MKKWAVTDIRWADEADMTLPFWQKWSKQNTLPDSSWYHFWEYPYVFSKIPTTTEDQGNYAHIIHSLEDSQDFLTKLQETLDKTNHRVVVTLKVGNTKGFPRYQLRELEEFLGIQIPQQPIRSLTSSSPVLHQLTEQKITGDEKVRLLGFTIDARDKRSVAILIPHWESFSFLRVCLESIQQFRNEQLDEKVFILDDASMDGSFEQAKELFKDDPNMIFLRFDRPNKDYDADVGLLLDYAIKEIREQYVLAIDADVFALSKDWITFPIWLLEKYHCSSVGLDTGLSTSYLEYNSEKSWWQPAEGYGTEGGLYDNEWFTCTNNLYRLMPTPLAKVVSEAIGFSRATLPLEVSRKLSRRVKNKLLRTISPDPKNVGNSRKPYLPPGCDNGVAANHFIDINHMGPKFNIPLTSFIGLTPKDGVFGQNISDLIFHFALSTRALSQERREVDNAGEAFTYWVNKLTDSNFNSSTLREIIEASRQFQSFAPTGHNGSVPAAWYEREFGYIEKLYRKFLNTSSESEL